MGLPSTSWQEFAVPRLMVRTVARLYSTLTVSVAAIAAGGYLQTAATLAPAGGVSPWLTLLAKSGYDNDRFLSTTNAGIFLLQDAARQGPTPIVAGRVIVGTPDGVLRWNIAPIPGQPSTLPLGGFLPVLATAEKPGGAYNIASNYTGLQLVTTLPGVLVTNPIPLGATTWVTAVGSDVESDAALIQRCVTKWAALGTGGGKDAYISWARTGAPAVTRVVVDDTNPDGPGTVRVTVATAAGAASGPDLAASDAYIQQRRALTATVTTLSASVLVVTVTGMVFVRAAQVAAATSAIAAALEALVEAVPIGGILYASQVEAAIGSAVGVRNFEGVTLNGFAVDIPLTSTQIATLSLALAYFIV